MATTTKKTVDLKVVCPKCLNLEPSNPIMMDLSELGRCVCGECDEEFTVAEAVEQMEEILARWKKVADWIKLAPTD
jgi:hypothetical protein